MPLAIQERSVATDYATLENFIAVKRREQDPEELTDGGLLKPQIAQDKPQWATVVAVSEKESELMVGDEVYISKYTAAEIEPFPGDKIVVIHKTLVYLRPKRRIQ